MRTETVWYDVAQLIVRHIYVGIKGEVGENEKAWESCRDKKEWKSI